VFPPVFPLLFPSRRQPFENSRASTGHHVPL
jgi:hypothetical protein